MISTYQIIEDEISDVIIAFNERFFSISTKVEKAYNINFCIVQQKLQEMDSQRLQISPNHAINLYQKQVL